MKIASDFQTSGLHNCLVEVVQIVFTCRMLERSVKHFSCVTEVARGVFSRQKELYVVL